ncbi:hypothetical protein PQX77_006165 [Marasmius sp. AFHP31]|nr:hypothetical protein PQX77_006165 [Marasmius sp. AFHP31]
MPSIEMHTPDDSNIGLIIGIPSILGFVTFILVFFYIRKRRQGTSSSISGGLRAKRSLARFVTDIDQERQDLETPDPLPIPPWEVQPSESEVTAPLLPLLSQRVGDRKERENDADERRSPDFSLERPTSPGSQDDVAVLRAQLNAVMSRVQVLEAGGTQLQEREQPPPDYSSVPHTPRP